MKKIILVIVAFIFIAIVGGLGVLGYNYYQSTYVGIDYYIEIPATTPPLTSIKELDGSKIGKGYEYTVTGYSETGASTEISFDVITTGESKEGEAYVPGTFYKVNASQNRIILMTRIPQSDIPSSIESKFQ